MISWQQQNIGSGWASNKYVHIISAGDLDGNGFTDMLLTDTAGKLWFYPATSQTKFGARKNVGHGWGSMKQLFGGIDFDGDKRIDILGVSKDGKLLFYPGKGNGYFAAKKEVGNGWGNATNISITQKGFNGKPLVMASFKGVLKAFPTDGRAHFLKTITYGSGWDSAKLTAITSDVSGDGFADMWVIMKNGELRLYTAKNSSGTSFFNFQKPGVRLGQREIFPAIHQSCGGSCYFSRRCAAPI